MLNRGFKKLTDLRAASVATIMVLVLMICAKSAMAYTPGMDYLGTGGAQTTIDTIHDSVTNWLAGAPGTIAAIGVLALGLYTWLFAGRGFLGFAGAAVGAMFLAFSAGIADTLMGFIV